MAVSASAEAGGAEERARVWPVEKYARFQQTTASAARKTDGIWQHYSSREGGIQLALVDSAHLIISSGTMIFESFSLWDAQKWLKIVTRETVPCLSTGSRFVAMNDNRRFRVKFLPTSSTATALDTCKQFAVVMATLVPIREMEAGLGTRDRGTTTRGDQSGSSVLAGESQLMMGDDFDSSQVVSETQSSESLQQNAVGPILTPDESSLIPIPDIGKLLQVQGKSLGKAYADTNFPTEQLGQFVRLCLTDANFPAFVECVERELNSSITNT